ncbi:MAG: hypothetical protein AB7G80_04920 [Dongiaceae bacterium]
MLGWWQSLVAFFTRLLDFVPSLFAFLQGRRMAKAEELARAARLQEEYAKLAAQHRNLADLLERLQRGRF